MCAYLINEVSKRVNLSQKRIREYEKEGFIKPERQDKTNNRLYSDFEVAQIIRINHLIHDRGFTVACLKNLLALAPCWNIFDCAGRRSCAAFHNPHQPCWKVKPEEGEGHGCEKCAVYLNRTTKKRKVLEPCNRTIAKKGENNE